MHHSHTVIYRNIRWVTLLVFTFRAELYKLVKSLYDEMLWRKTQLWFCKRQRVCFSEVGVLCNAPVKTCITKPTGSRNKAMYMPYMIEESDKDRFTGRLKLHSSSFAEHKEPQTPERSI